MNFNKNGFIVIKQAINKELANFIYNYFLLKREVAKAMFDKGYINPFSDYFGTWSDEQVPNTYSHYSDIVMETLLEKVKPIMEKQTKLKLIPTYSYARIYKKGDILNRHKDRFSCEISTTLNLGGDPWPIFISKNEKEGKYIEDKYIPSKEKGIEINLNQGDMLVYKGNLLEHWREIFKGKDCGQVFLHYNNSRTEGSELNIYDGRPHLGLPIFFKNKK
jgi:hypothetical protein